MRKITLYYSIIILILLLFSCGDKKKQGESVINQTFFVKSDSLWVLSKIGDFNKNLKDVNIDQKLKLSFGDKIVIEQEKSLNNVLYYQFKKSEQHYWIKASSLVNGFFVIIKDNIDCYQFPEENYKEEIQLMAGDLGIVLDENKDWYFLDFWAYRDRNGKIEYVGKKWIKKQRKNYNDEPVLIKEAYYLSQAYYYYYLDKNRDLSLVQYFINKGLNVEVRKKKSFVYNKLQAFSNEILKKD